MIKVVSVLIGNSDDKLTQKGWSEFVQDVRESVDWFKDTIQFEGSSSPTSEYQNYCTVFTIKETLIARLKEDLISARVNYGQDAIAWVECDGEIYL